MRQNFLKARYARALRAALRASGYAAVRLSLDKSSSVVRIHTLSLLRKSYSGSYLFTDSLVAIQS